MIRTRSKDAPQHSGGFQLAFKRELARHAHAIARTNERHGVDATQLAAYDAAIDAMDFMSKGQIDTLMQVLARQTLRTMWPRFRRAVTKKPQPAAAAPVNSTPSLFKKLGE